MSAPIHPEQLKLMDVAATPSAPKARTTGDSTPSGPFLPPRQAAPIQPGRPGGPPMQPKMFMSAREVMDQYQPLEGDRQDFYDVREGEGTNRLETTWGKPNAPLTSHDRGNWAAAMETGVTHYRQWGHEETDEQVWDRKLEESHMPADEYQIGHHGQLLDRTPGYETLMDRASAPQIGSSGRDQYGYTRSSAREQHDYDMEDYVVRKQDEHRWNRDDSSLHETLSHAMRPGGEGFTGLVHLGTQFGTSGKQQVVGAHHRLAIMNDIAPDRLLPVVHHTDLASAKKQGYGGQKYT